MPSFEDLSPATQAKIDALCDTHEEQLRRGNTPDIRALLATFEESSDRQTLFHELLRLEAGAPTWSADRCQELRVAFPEYADAFEVFVTVHGPGEVS